MQINDQITLLVPRVDEIVMHKATIHAVEGIEVTAVLTGIDIFEKVGGGMIIWLDPKQGTQFTPVKITSIVTHPLVIVKFSPTEIWEQNQVAEQETKVAKKTAKRKARKKAKKKS